MINGQKQWNDYYMAPNPQGSITPAVDLKLFLESGRQVTDLLSIFYRFAKV